MNRVPLKQIVLPLAASAGLCLAIAYFWPVDGLWLNLGTELIGILVTVWYVDWILDRHDESRWRSTDLLVNEQLKVALTDVVLAVRQGLQDLNILEDPELREDTNVLTTLVDQAAGYDVDRVRKQIDRVGSKGMEALGESVDRALESLARFFDRYSHRLNPETSTLVIRLERALNESKLPISVVREVDLSEVELDSPIRFSLEQGDDLWRGGLAIALADSFSLCTELNRHRSRAAA
ncbi:hypothetical protein Pan44_43270 [Caulifigura coniformis]|uniref:Uncharacterized protein n=1 Tax=Caulifigura coniformis TaxID=2527983 RepID=A0A517SJH2_9PLAN|nr:hypothetical protein [Caulifigura coniformis]QDT56274.1 hypothetical protein Pan44_43270 [Caulifigura coniformis]